MENPIKMDDLGIPLFLETPRSYMDGSENREYPQIIHFNKVFHYKPSILGYP